MTHNFHWLMVLLTQTWLLLALLNLSSWLLEVWWNMRCSLYPQSPWSSQQFKLSLSCPLQFVCRFVSENKTKYITTAKPKKKKNPEKSKTTEKKSQKTPILKAQSITLKAQCMWLPCYKSLSTLHFNSSFTASPLCATCFLKAQMQFFTFLGLTLQVKELNYTSSYRPEAIYLKKFAHLRSSIEWKTAYCRTVLQM